MSNRKFSKILALCLAVVLTAASSAAASAATTSDSGAGREETLSCAEVKNLPDGGKAYVYFIDGIENIFPVPPEGFHPVEATDSQLKEYGFPARPKNAADLAKWTETMSAYKRTPVPAVTKRPDRNHNNVLEKAPKPADSVTVNSLNGVMGSYNWSGYAAKGGTNTYAEVQGDYNQPTVRNTGSANTYECSWVGLGGYGTEKLVQAGTEADRRNGRNVYYAWYEYLGSSGAGVSQISLPSITVRPGNRIHTYVSFQRSNGVLNCYVANNTNGTSQSVIVNLPTSTYYDGSTAEWIDERTNVNGNGNTNLTNFGTINWTNCQAYLSSSSKWVSLGSQTYDRIIMVSYDSDHHYLTEPDALSSNTSFTNRWLSSN